jgi:hypothetical protein
MDYATLHTQMLQPFVWIEYIRSGPRVSFIWEDYDIGIGDADVDIMYKDAVDMLSLPEASFTGLQDPSSYMGLGVVTNSEPSAIPATRHTMSGLHCNSMVFANTYPSPHGLKSERSSSSEETAGLTRRQNKRRAQNREA